MAALVSLWLTFTATITFILTVSAVRAVGLSDLVLNGL